MLDLVFGHHLTYVVLVAAVSAVAGAAVLLLTRRRSDRPWEYAAWTAFTTAAVLLTLWVKGDPSSGICTVNADVAEPLGTAQGLMNIALFVPIGLFGLRSVRRPVPAVLSAALLSGAIETVQAAVPAIGRYCDTSDLVANVAGGAVGVGLGLLSLRLSPRALPPWGVGRRSLAAVTLGVVSVLAGVLAGTARAQVVAHAEQSRPASAEQRAAVDRVVRQALGPGVRVRRVFVSDPLGGEERVAAELDPDATVLIAWPDQDDISFDLWGSRGPDGAPAGYPVTGVTGPVHDALGARRAADRYVAAHYPSAATAGRPLVEGAGEAPGAAWTVVYRYHDVRAPAPASLKVTVNGAGRLSGVHLSAVAPGSTGDSARPR